MRFHWLCDLIQFNSIQLIVYRITKCAHVEVILFYTSISFKSLYASCSVCSNLRDDEAAAFCIVVLTEFLPVRTEQSRSPSDGTREDL